MNVLDYIKLDNNTELGDIKELNTSSLNIRLLIFILIIASLSNFIITIKILYNI